jgi:cell wall-active antibiotic response 4TMS protein YvqF
VTSPNHTEPAAPPAPSPHRALVPARLVPERRGVVAFISHVVRGGDWILARHFRAVAFMGGVDIDLTRARLGPGTSQVEIKAFLGTVRVVVPPDLRVECEGDSIVASFEIDRDTVHTPPPDAPLVVISGTALLGAVEVKVVDPDAPGWYEKLRGRWGR